MDSKAALINWESELLRMVRSCQIPAGLSSPRLAKVLNIALHLMTVIIANCPILGFKPVDTAKHHRSKILELLKEALEQANVNLHHHLSKPSVLMFGIVLSDSTQRY